MFTRIKKSGKNQYLQIVENRREGDRIKQRVICTLGRLERLKEKGEIERLVHSFAKYSEKALLVLSGKSDVTATTKKIGPSLIFGRLWDQLRIKEVIRQTARGRKFGFDAERAIYLTVLHRLFLSGSDRSCEQWKRDYVMEGSDEIGLHQLYRAMAWLGEPVANQAGATGFTPRCVKDEIEEGIFFENRDLFSGLDLVFFDTTSLYFEGAGGESIGKLGNSKDHRADCNQMVVGVSLDGRGRPICCELWPGNTADVKTLLPVVRRMRSRFGVKDFCVVVDRGMVSRETLERLEDPREGIRYIVGMRMRKVKEVRNRVLSQGGRYREVYPESNSKKDPHPLKVKEVQVNGRRYIVCLNEREARKDAATREAIIEGLKEKLKTDAKSLIGNKGYRRYIKLDRAGIGINFEKIEEEERFDGKWVLQTNTQLSNEQVALKYKQLWEVEHAFRDIKSLLETRPIFHKRDETIRGHVFCSFLALVLRKELFRRLETVGYEYEWTQIQRDLQALQETTIEDGGKTLAVRSQCLGSCSKVFQATGVAVPPAIRELQS